MFNQKINYYRIRPFPGKKDRFEDFKEKSFISLGWEKIGDVAGNNRQQISSKLKQNYPEMNNRAIGLAAGAFIKMQAMKPGDRVIIPYQNKQVSVAVVVKPYQFNSAYKSDDMAHDVGIKFLKTLPVSAVSKEMKSSIDTMPTLISLEKYENEIENIISGDPMVVQKNSGNTFSFFSSAKFITLTISSNVEKKDLEEFINRVTEF